MRPLWLLGEIVGGVLLAGVVMGLVVPVARHWDIALGTWVTWSVLALSIIVTVAVVERVRRGPAQR